MSVGPIDPAALPADIRAGSATRREAYKAALEFEKVLTTQLAETMLPKAGGTAGAHAKMLPEALADGLLAAGGLGLARSLTDAVAPEERR